MVNWKNIINKFRGKKRESLSPFSLSEVQVTDSNSSIEDDNGGMERMSIEPMAAGKVIARGQLTLIDLTDIISQPTAPTPPKENMLWMDTSKTPPVLMVYKNGAWVKQNDFKDDPAYSTITETLTKNTADIEINKEQIALKVTQTEVTNTVVTEVNKTVKSVVSEYAKNQNATTAPTTGWSVTPPTWADGWYIWSRTKTTMMSGLSNTSDPVNITGATGSTGVPGSDGRGIKATTIEYQKSTSGTTAPTGTWTTSIPSVSANEYLWTRTTITYTDNSTPTVAYSVGKMGATGATGPTGATGATGATGQGVESITSLYKMLDTKTQQPTPTSDTGWSTTPPTWQSGKYIHTCSKIVYKNPTATAYTVPMCDNSWEAANGVQDDLNNKYSQITDKFAGIDTSLDEINLEIGEITTANYVKDVLNDSNSFLAGVGTNQTNKDINGKIKKSNIKMTLEGNTIVNRYRPETLKFDVANFVKYGDYGFRYTVTTATPGGMVYPAFSNPTLKDGTKYTFIAKIVKNTFTGSNVFRIGRTETTGAGTIYINGGVTGIVAVALTTNSAGATNWYSPISNWGITQGVVGELVVEYVMMIEGDWTGGNDPEYFNGVKSLGDNGPVQVISKNKNLFDYKDVGDASSEICELVNLNNGSFSITGKRASDNYIQTNGRVYLTKGTQYNFSATSNFAFGNSGDTVELYLLYRDSYETLIINLGSSNQNFTPTKTGWYNIRFDVNSQKTATISNIQIRASHTTSPYVDGTTSVSSLDVNGLSKLPNGIKDQVIESEDGKMFIQRNIGKINVTPEMLTDAGNEGFPTRTKTWLLRLTDARIKSVPEDALNCWADTLPNARTYQTDFEGVMIANNSNYVWIAISREKLASTSVADLTTYLKANPLTIYFELSDVDKSLEKINNGFTVPVTEYSTIIIDEEIPTGSKHSVALNAMATIENAISSIEMTKNSIEQKVDVNGVIAAINIGVEDDESNILIMAEKIKLKGAVTVESLTPSLKQIFEYGSDKTVIDGGYIKSGSIDLEGEIRVKEGITITEGFEEGAKVTFNVSPEGNVNMAGTVQSLNFDNTQGWKIDQSGNAIFNEGEFRSKVVLPRAGMSKEGNVRIWAGGDIPGQALFRVYDNGDCNIEKGYFKGVFSGSIEIGGISISDDGLNTGRGLIQIKDNTEKVVTEIADDSFTVGTNAFFGDKLSITSTSHTKILSGDFNFKDSIVLKESDSSISFNNDFANFRVNETKFVFTVNDTSQSTDFEFSNPNRDTIVQVNGQLKVSSNVDIGVVTIRKQSTGIDFLFI